MVNRTLRRNQSGTDNVARIDTATVSRTDDGDTISVQRIERAESDTDRSTVADDSDTLRESNNTQPIGVVEVDPSELGNVIAERAARRDDNGDGKRTRRSRSDAGVKRGRKRKETPQNVEALVTMVHTWAAVVLKTPELMLDSDEVKQLSTAYETFTEFHEVPILTPKRMSEINLISTALIIYGTRFVAIKNRRKNQRANNVTEMPNRGVVGH